MSDNFRFRIVLDRVLFCHVLFRVGSSDFKILFFNNTF
jgi:hypothetical protein